MGKKQADARDAASTEEHRDQRALHLRHSKRSVAIFGNENISAERAQSSPEIGLEIAT